MSTEPVPANWKPRFFIIWSGQSLSLIGSSLTQFVLIWWITQETGSAGAVALAGAMGLLPSAIFSPFGGAVADRLSRRWLMVAADTITALSMLVLVLLFAGGRVELWHVYTLMFVRATMQSFQQPAAAASTANLVPKAWLERVAGMNQAVQGIMAIASAPLGALALAFLPTQGALMIDVVTAFLGVVPLLFYQIPQPRPSHHGAPQSIFHDIRDGARYVLSIRGLAPLYLAVGLVVLTVIPTFSLTPLLVKQHFNGGVNQVAVMEGLAGVGMILGGVLVGLWNFRGRRVYVMLSSFSISCGTVAFTALAPPDGFWLAVFWWFVSGVSGAFGNAPFVALLQDRVPNHLQGRALALLNMVVGVAGPLGLAIGGPLAEAFGVRALYIGAGILSALVNLMALLPRSIREIETHIR